MEVLLTKSGIDAPASKDNPSLMISPIYRLNHDILILIFQEIAEERVIELRNYARKWRLLRGRSMNKSRAPSTPTLALALVCRTWRNLVYSLKYLWPVISMNIGTPIERALEECDRVTSLAGDRPIDFYLWSCQPQLRLRVHLPSNADVLPPLPPVIAADPARVIGFDKFKNLRSLFLQLQATTLDRMIKRLPLTAKFPNLQILTLKSEPDSYRPRSVNLYPLLSKMPNITQLTNDSSSEVYIYDAQKYHYLLPNIRILDLSEQPNRLQKFDYASWGFIYHSPTVETLRISARGGSTGLPGTWPAVNLSHLHTLRVNGNQSLCDLFQLGGATKHRLRKLEIASTDAGTNFRAYYSFLVANPDIRLLEIETGEPETSWFHPEEILVNLPPTIEKLTLRNLTAVWLDILSRAEHNLSTDPTKRVCPYIHRLVIADSPAPPLKAFTDFVHARFLPIDDSGRTKAGYKAMEALVLHGIVEVLLLEELKQSEVWKTASVRKTYDDEYELCWV